METQHSEQHNGGEAEEFYDNEDEVILEATRNTIRIIKRKYSPPKNALFCTIHDKTSPGYEWLLLGWLAEERHVQSGMYKFYYDPGANRYRSKREVVDTWEHNRLILIEDDE